MHASDRAQRGLRPDGRREPRTDARRGHRADARRNYERLLAEADATFREHGTAAPLEGIARRAGVAIGTLYGHFPSRRALVGALLRDRNEALFDLGDELLVRPSVGQALDAWVRAVAAHAAQYGGLATLLAEGLDDEASELHAACQRMADIGARLVVTAREAGAIRPEVTGADIFALMNAAAWVREQMSADQAGRLMSYALEGLRPAGTESRVGEPAVDMKT